MLRVQDSGIQAASQNQCGVKKGLGFRAQGSGFTFQSLDPLNAVGTSLHILATPRLGLYEPLDMSTQTSPVKTL